MSKTGKSREISEKVRKGLMWLNRGIAALLLLMLVFYHIPSEWLSAAETDEDDSGGFELSMNWNSGDDPAHYEYYSAEEETRTIRLNVRYANKDMGDVEYAPGEVVISVKGIGYGYWGTAAAGAAKEADSVGADKASAQNKTRAFSYTYTRATDTYTFTNNNTLKPTENFAGSFELLWQIPSRQSVDQYETKTQAVLRAKNGVQVESNEVTYKQERIKDAFELELEASPLSSTQGYDFSDKNGEYYWVKYQAVSRRNLYSWGLQSSAFEVTIPSDGELCYAARKVTANGEGVPVSWGSGTASGVNTSYRVNASVDDETVYLDYIVKYPRDAYSAKAASSAVRTLGIYHETDTEVELDNDTEEIYLSGYTFPDYQGYIVGGAKSARGTGVGTSFAAEHDVYNKGYVDSRHMEAGREEYTFSLYGIVNHYAMIYDCYDLEITDEKLEVMLEGSNGYRRLKDGEYTFTSVRIPSRNNVRNANGEPVADGTKILIQTKTGENGNYQDYTTVTLGNSEQRISFQTGNIYGVRMLVEDMQESIRITVPVTVKFDADVSDIRLDQGELVNTMDIDLYAYDDPLASGRMLEGVQGDGIQIPESAEISEELDIQVIDEQEEEEPTQSETSAETAEETEGETAEEQQDAQVTPKHRTTTRKPEETGTESMQPVYTSDDGYLHNYVYETGKTKSDPYHFFAGMEKMHFGDTLKILIRPNYYNHAIQLDSFTDDGKNGMVSTLTLKTTFDYLDGEMLQKFSMYTILPEDIELGSGIFDADSLFDAMDVSSSAGVSAAELRRSMAIEIVENYQGSGRTYLAFTFDLGKSAIAEPTGTAALGIPVYVAKKTYYGGSGSYKAYGVTMIEDTDLYVYPKYGDAVDGGSYAGNDASLWKDINGDGNQTERLSYSTAARTASVYAYASQVAATKSVKTSTTGGKYVQPSKGGGGYSEEEIPGTAVKETYTYELQINIGSDRYRQASDIVIMDVLETAPDSVWKGTFVSADISQIERILSAYNEKAIKGTLYYSDKDYSADIAAADNNYQPNLGTSDWKRDASEVSEVRTIAASFGDAAISGSEYLTMEVTMEAPQQVGDGAESLAGKITENEFGIFYHEEDLTGKSEQQIWLPSNMVPVSLNPYRADVFLIKTDAYDNSLLEGAEYALYRMEGMIPVPADDTLVQSGLVTNARGRLVIRDLQEGSYYLLETKAPLGYQLPDQPDYITFEINEADAKNINLTAENKRKPGKAILEKRNKENLTTLVEGAVFSLYHEDGTLIQDNLSTDSHGRIVVSDLEWGAYYFIEDSAPAGYDAADDTKYWFEINAANDAGELLTVDVKNSQTEYAKVKLVKYEALEDGTTTTGPLEGVAFLLYRADGEEQGTYVTDEHGTFEIELPYGAYYFEEVIRKVGYDIETSALDFQLSASDPDKELVVYNRRRPGKVELYKLNERNQYLAGAEYGLYGEDGTLIETKITDAEGVLSFDAELKWGEYYVQEITAPQGHELDTREHPFTVNAKRADNTIVLTMRDETIKGKVQLHKIDGGTNAGLNGAVFNLYKVDGTLYRENLITKTDENGVSGILYEDELEWGSYYFQEVEAPTGYSLSDEKIRFSVNARNCEVVQELTAENESGKISLILHKQIPADSIVYAHGNPSFLFKIEGVGAGDRPYTWYRTVTFSDGTGEHITGLDGKNYIQLSTTLADIPVGKYVVSEVDVIRYRLREILDVSSPGVTDQDAGTVTFDLTNYTDIDIPLEATFLNTKPIQEGDSAVVLAQNLVKAERKLSGLTVEYRGDTTLETGETYDPDQLYVYAMYDDGEMERLPYGKYEINLKPEEIANSGSTGYETITVSHTEGGVTKRGSFTLLTGEGQGPFKWKVNENGTTATIVEYTGNKAVVVFPEKVEGTWNDNLTNLIEDGKVYQVTGVTGEYNKNIFGADDNEMVTTVILPENITKIGNYAFQSCMVLESINLPSGLTDIGTNSFFQCANLKTSINIETDDIVDIGSSAFGAGVHLQEIKIKGSEVKIGNYAFSGIKGGGNVEIIGLRLVGIAMFMASEINDVKIVVSENSELWLDNNAFNGSKLKSIEISGNLVSIGQMTFGYCEKLERIKLPDTSIGIQMGAFYECTGITESVIVPVNADAQGSGVFKNFAANDTSNTVKLYLPESWRSVDTGADSNKIEYYTDYDEIPGYGN